MPAPFACPGNAGAVQARLEPYGTREPYGIETLWAEQVW
ncbi:hypothetical protein ABH927_002261 [Planotetraspora sp. GP83]